MVAPIVKSLYDQEVTSGASIVYTPAVKIYDVDLFSILLKNTGASNAITYVVQVSSDATSPTNWFDWIGTVASGVSLANAASFSQSYAQEGFRWMRVGYTQVTGAETLRIQLSKRTEKVI